MIVYILLAAAVALLAWPDSPKQSLEDREQAVARPKRPVRKRKEAPKNERKA